jgi:isopenicillin-N epimerase
MPVERIVPELRERGIETLIDGAHAPGQIALDFDGLGAGYVTGNAHKWLCTPKGAAYLWVRRDLQAGLRPTTISHGANDRRTTRSRFLIEFDWQGTIDPTAILCIPTALDFLGGLFPGSVAELRAKNHALAIAGRDIILGAVGGAPSAPDDMLGAMATIRLPDDAPADPRSAFDTLPLQDRLYAEHKIEVPVMQWPAPGNRALRVSAQAYNTLDDYRRLADALRVELG